MRPDAKMTHWHESEQALHPGLSRARALQGVSHHICPPNVSHCGHLMLRTLTQPALGS